MECYEVVSRFSLRFFFLAARIIKNKKERAIILPRPRKSQIHHDGNNRNRVRVRRTSARARARVRPNTFVREKEEMCSERVRDRALAQRTSADP